jgi:CheY-like chemotaxis protein
LQLEAALPLGAGRDSTIGKTIRILIADDYDDWRRKARQLLQKCPDLHIICEVSDGSEAVQKVEELKPDLIVLDIGLPKLNGIEAARRIRELSPNSKIIFLSQHNSYDVVQTALSTGALAYVYKAQAGSELLPTVEAVVRTFCHSWSWRGIGSDDSRTHFGSDFNDGANRARSIFCPAIVAYRRNRDTDCQVSRTPLDL